MSDYLSHYGIKGQKWGVRRFQNKDGSRTPEGRKRYDGALTNKEKSKIAKDIQKYYRKNVKSDSNSHELDIGLGKSNDFVNKLHNSSGLKDARTKLDKFKKLIDDYDLNDDVQYEYKIKAMGKWSDYSEAELRKMYTKDNTYFMYDDWDQGDYGSFDLYLRDHGSNLGKFSFESEKLVKEYENSCKKVVDSLLGEYGNKTVARRNAWEDGRVKGAVSDALVKLASDEKKLYYRFE